MTCDECPEQIAVLCDEMDNADESNEMARALSAHLAACPQCAAEAEAARQVHERLACSGATMRDRALADDVMARIARHPAPSAVMTRRVRVRWALGLAALIALAVTAALLWPSNGGGSSSALASVIERVRQAESLSVTVRKESGDDGDSLEVLQLGGEATRVRLPDGRIIITDIANDRSLMLIPEKRVAIENAAPVSFLNMREMLLDLVPNVVDVLGTEEMGGAEVVVLRAPWPEAMGRADGWTVTVWADLHSGLPVRVEAKAADGSPGRVVFSNIVFDDDVDPSLFSLEVPEGYTLASTSSDPKVAAAATNRAMVKILMACQIYMSEHEGQWPAGLNELDRYGIDAATLKNPRYPHMDVGYVYVRPVGNDPAEKTIVLYEYPEIWGAGINVGFADTHVEFISDPMVLKTMRAEQQR